MSRIPQPILDATRPASGHPRRQLIPILGATALTTPAILTRLSGAAPPEWVAAVVFGLGVVGAAFLLAWGAEALQLDVSQGLALALLALIAVLPEYAVDFTFALKAGEDPDKYAPLALANMTGGNRLLIGVGWSLVVLLAAWRITRVARAQGYEGPLETDVTLDRPHAIEIAFLAVASVYSLTLPLKSTLSPVDSVLLVGLFVWYAVRISRAPAEEPHLVGPAELIGRLPTATRRAVVALMLVGSAAVILISAEPFADSLVKTGEQFGIDTFLLVQWVAPLASEAPELLVAGLFAWRLNTNAGLGALVSSKVNQWTLLVGTLPLVFSISAGVLSGLPIDALQREELFLTAAQSIFAVAVLTNRSISVREALALMGLFVTQFVLGGVLPDGLRAVERIGIGILYLMLAAIVMFQQRRYVRPLVRDGFRTSVTELVHEREQAPAEA
ncbi:MAG TPA: sodium:proton exchanger [Acidimicrobiia bacterium]|jgi:cation:H+ antiporter|nr:sodium:proton exchanger [Acidimicrobiia bacterium]